MGKRKCDMILDNVNIIHLHSLYWLSILHRVESATHKVIQKYDKQWLLLWMALSIVEWNLFILYLSTQKFHVCLISLTTKNFSSKNSPLSCFHVFETIIMYTHNKNNQFNFTSHTIWCLFFINSEFIQTCFFKWNSYFISSDADLFQMTK